MSCRRERAEAELAAAVERRRETERARAEARRTEDEASEAVDFDRVRAQLDDAPCAERSAHIRSLTEGAAQPWICAPLVRRGTPVPDAALLPAMPDLAPDIYRQRLVVEGLCRTPIDAASVRTYLCTLSDRIDMITIAQPVTHRSSLYGWAGWIHWETSGAHFYAWETPRFFFSVDIYACKPFGVEAVVEFTRDFFDSPHVVARQF